MPTTYTELLPTDIHKTLEIIQSNGDFSFDPDKTRILTQDLPFAEGWKRIICEDYSSLPYKNSHFLQKGKVIHQINYTPEPYEDNSFKELDIHLDETNVLHYLMFYYDYCLSSPDRLKPVLHVDDIEWQDDLPPMTRQSLEKEFHAYPKITFSGGSFYVITACIFRFSIMEVTFFVKNDGKPEIKDSRVLLDDLPVKSFP